VRNPGRRAFSALVISITLAACGSSSSSNDGAAVKQTMTRALHALATGDGTTLCSLATPAGRKTLAAALPHQSCPSIVKLVSAHLSPALREGLASVKVKRVTISGNRATISDTDITSSQGTLQGFIQPNSPPTQLTKESDGSWKISG
jgi:hypothetical protein